MCMTVQNGWYVLFAVWGKANV